MTTQSSPWGEGVLGVMLVYKPRIRRSEIGWKIANITMLIIEHD